MTDNPFMRGGGGKPPKAPSTKESLEAYAHDLNRMKWVIASGQPYFVNRRLEPDSTVKHFLDRKIYQ